MGNRDDDSSASESALGSDSAASDQDSSSSHAAASPPRKKSRKSHKSRSRKHRAAARSAESETDGEKENRRRKQKHSEQRRQRRRERLSRTPEDGADAEGRSAVEEDGGRRRHRDRESSRTETGERRRGSERDRDRRRDRRGDQSQTRRDPDRVEPAVRVKEEPVSDDERERRRRRPRGDERRRRDASPRHRRAASVEPKRERRGSRDRRGPRDDADSGQRWGLHEPEPAPETAAPVEKEAPNFALSGKLVEDTNTVNGVVVKYSEPPEARKPKRRWRLYVFKGDESMPTLHIHRQSAFLMGRDRKVADIPIDHPSCSKQHAVLQYRLAKTERDDGTTMRTVRPYIIDLESANGTYVNNQRIAPARYVELMERDVVKFGFSSREYVLLHDTSQGDPSGSGD